MCLMSNWQIMFNIMSSPLIWKCLLVRSQENFTNYIETYKRLKIKPNSVRNIDILDGIRTHILDTLSHQSLSLLSSDLNHWTRSAIYVYHYFRWLVCFLFTSKTCSGVHWLYILFIKNMQWHLHISFHFSCWNRNNSN